MGLPHSPFRLFIDPDCNHQKELWARKLIAPETRSLVQNTEPEGPRIGWRGGFWANEADAKLKSP